MNASEPNLRSEPLRKVAVKNTARSDGPTDWVGYFHTWALFQSSLSVPHNTVALVENLDGRLHYVWPEEMQFLDKVS